MLKQLKAWVRNFLKRIFGENIFIYYSYFLAYLAAFVFGNPSKKMYVVAVTGTKGKTSTLNFIWHVLTAGGYKVGLISTANIKIGNEEIANWYHMTMPGRFLLQRLLYKMFKARCDVVLVEATSEGMKMGRHVGLYYDAAVFTNLTPEHLKSHNNSFSEYREAKAILFKELEKLPLKRWNGMDLDKIIIANLDDENGEFYYGFNAGKKYSYGDTNGDYRFSDVKVSSAGTSFVFEENQYEFPLMGKFNVYNAMPAVLLAKYLEVSDEEVKTGLKNCDKIPGRMEVINEGQNFTAIVDYAHEGVSMNAAIDASLLAKKTPESKLFVVFGGDGGGREPRIGSCEAVAKKANFGIVTLSDPFDTDPEIINKFLMKKLGEFGMKEGENCFDFLDRRDAIKFVVEMAGEGDVALFTCKGAEQSIIFKDRVEPWDDRVEVREAIKKYVSK